MGLFPTSPPRVEAWTPTRWSIVRVLDRRQDPGWDEGWAYLVETYGPIMERYLRRALARSGRRGSTAEEAADLLQAFLVDCVEKGWLSRATPERGKFRAFIQMLLRRYTISHLRHGNSQRRRPADGKKVLALLPDDVMASDGDEADFQEFDRGWASIAVDQALARLERENARHATIVRDLITTGGSGSSDLAEQLRLNGPQLAVLKHRARKRLHTLFFEELRSTVDNQEAFDDEWRALRPHLPGVADA